MRTVSTRPSTSTDPAADPEREANAAMLQLTLREPHATRVTTVMHVARFSVVLGLHLALLFWLALAQPQEASDLNMVRMDVRTIEAPPAPGLLEPPPMAPPPTIPLPLPQRVAAPKPPPTPMPVLTAATAEGPAPMTAGPPSHVPVEAIASTSPAVAAATGPTAPAAAPAPEPAPVVTQARFDADYLNNPAPVYPLTSRMMKEQGTVLLLVNVSAQGDAERVRLHQSSSKPRLDEAAQEAVRHWRFVPAKRGAQAVPASVIVPIVFELDR